MPPRLPLWGSWHGEAVTEEVLPAAREPPPATAWLSPLINAGGRNGGKRPRLPLWGSWHGEAVTEEVIPAAAGNSPRHFVALPPHKCGGQERRDTVAAPADAFVPFFHSTGGFCQRHSPKIFPFRFSCSIFNRRCFYGT